MPSQSRASVRQAWVDRVDLFQLSNQTVAEFCHAGGISQASLYQWRKRLRLDGGVPIRAEPMYVHIKMPAAEASSPTTVLSVELPAACEYDLKSLKFARQTHDRFAQRYGHLSLHHTGRLSKGL